MDAFQKRLIGALIGLARSTDGNEHLITPDITAVVVECLTAVPPDEAALQNLFRRVEEAKRSMVPDCFLCANPCGRTSDYDLNDLQNADDEVRRLKYQILAAMQTLAASGATEYDPKLLYQGLVVIGMEDYNVEDLTPILQQLESMTAR